jgi:NAD-dependent SIR2 family protein deacetylase
VVRTRARALLDPAYDNGPMDAAAPTSVAETTRPGAPPAVLGELIALLETGRTVVLSGAGLSTESGIPDYRGPSGALRRHAPMTFQSFTGDPVARHRYWARSYLGWRQIKGARPNAGHRAVTALQRAGLVSGIVTQNVDGLHQAAGATGVIELHGGLDRVICRNCGHVVDRARLDRDLHAANPTFDATVARINPDGDADLADDELAGFVMIDCESCGGGPLKPDVVFFGETVPRDRVEQCFDLVDRADSLLVLGSSLTVMSGFRFVLRAAKLGIPVAIVNQGPTRGDGHCTVRVDAPLGGVLPALADRLG